jgi:glycosyltransferase involved in cell wall biosynthesis
VASADSLDAGSQGMKVRVLCLEGSPMHEHLAHQKTVTLFPLAFKPRNHLDFKLRAELTRHISEGVNLIHSHQPSLLGSIVPWIGGRSKMAVYATRHIMNDHSKNDFYHRLIYSRLDALIVMSQTLRKNVIQTHAIRERLVKVINLGLDFDRFDPTKVDPSRVRASWGADKDTVVIGLVGRIDPAKGQATFIRAAAGLTKNESGRNLKFVIVGEETLGRTSTHLAELKEMVRQFRLESHVVFAGYQENIPEVMSGFDVCVMPSRQEAFGLVAIEAMAMECPIVISSGGSAEEIVGNQEFGLVVRPDDAFDLQRQLRRLLDDQDGRVQMGKLGRVHVVNHYDRRIRLQKTLTLYERSLRMRGL